MNLKATNKTETNKYELEVEISAEDFNKALSEVAKTEGKKMSVSGFRKGHAPRSVIEKMYGENVFFEAAVDKLYRPAMQDAIEASGLEVIAVSNADVTSVSRENGIELKLTVVVKPVITIEGYKGIEATKKNVEVTDEDVSAELVKVQDRNSRMVDVDNRGALTGDTAVIDFEGFCDGKAFEGGKAEGFELSLGSGQFIPGFEDQIVGHEVGDEFEISVKFPEDYQAEELKGKDATFKIKLHQIKRKELPTLDDEFAKDVSEFDTLDEYKNSLREKLQSDREKQEETNVENQIFDALIEKVQGEIPEEMYEQEVEESINNFAYRLQSQGLNLETYLKYTGMDVNAIKEQFRPQSEKQLKLRLALEKIAELENLEVSDEAVEEEYEKLAKQYNMEVAQIKNLVAETQIRADLKNQKAIDFVKENASVKAEKPAKKTTRRKSTKKAAEEKTEETAEAKTEE
ncbi:trigger factor [Hominenteromicrobium sp.]|uniref:trigger factor n=1 Tax=Hominenteromicrobium sp. TaxID=3073581 RepID=UPI003AAFE95C